MKPTGGPLLLDDSQPDQPKSLVEEKLKKVTTETAPVAGQVRNAAGGRPSASGRSPLEGLAGLVQARTPLGSADPQTPGGVTNLETGAAAAAAVLTAVDEDGEEDEEAQIPGEFDYFSDDEPNIE